MIENNTQPGSSSVCASVPMWKWLMDCPLDGYSVVFACVSVGNVAQLAADLLVSSLNMQRAASLYSPAFVPMCGADPYNLASPDLCGPADFYIHPATRTALILIRAPLLRNHTRVLLNDIISSLRTKDIKELIIMSSSFAHEKHQVMSSSFRYFTNDLFQNTVDPGWIKHEKVNDELLIHGGGVAPMLLEICTAQGVPAMILFKYVSEGDNIPDAIESVVMLSRVLPLFPDISGSPVESRLKQPVSWRLLFGGPPPDDLY